MDLERRRRLRLPHPHPDFRRHFKTFQEAEQTLNGRDLRVEAFDSEGGPVAEEALPVLRSPVERVYFADVTGCPRGRFMIGEEIYLGFLHADHSQPIRYFYLTEYRDWALGDSLLDLRGDPETLTLPDDGEHIIFLLDVGDIANFGGGPRRHRAPRRQRAKPDRYGPHGSVSRGRWSAGRPGRHFRRLRPAASLSSASWRVRAWPSPSLAASSATAAASSCRPPPSGARSALA